MSNWDIGVITDGGRAALAKLEAGTATLEFASMAIGSGVYSAGEKALLTRAVALKSQKLSSEFSSKRFVSPDVLALKASFSNETVSTDFYVTECGIFVDVTENGTTSTVLFSIGLTDTPDVMSAYNGSYPQIITNEYYLPISSEANITVQISSVAYALAEDLDALNDRVDDIDADKVEKTDIAPIEDDATLSQDYAAGDQFYHGGILYKAKTTLASGTAWSSLTLDTDYEVAEDVGSQISTLANNVSANTTAIGKAYKSDDIAESTMDDADYIPFYDTSAGTPKKISKSNANFGGGGSVINLTTGDEGLLGQAVTISDGVTTLSGQFSQEGECTFNGVVLTGTLTISSTAEGAQVTDTMEVPYYGTYTKNFGRNAKTIDITTDEPTLLGQTVTATYGTKTKTATISAQGTASITLYNYTGAVTLSATDGEETAEENITITSSEDVYTVELGFSKIYGVQWDGTTNTAFTRTDAAVNFPDPVPQMKSGSGWTVGSSPFDNIMPWAGMEKVEDASAGTLVKIPKYYYKWTKTGTTMNLQISMKQEDGFRCSPAHSDRGDGKGERDYVYIGRYHCAPDYKSKTNVKPKGNETRAAFRAGIHNLGPDIYQNDWPMFWTVRMLYTVEFAAWHSQEKIGYGCGNNSGTENMGYTDAMTYHTGTTQSSRTAYGLGTQYRYIEGLWDNVLDWCDGIYFSGTDVYAIMNPENFSDSSGGTKIGTRPSTSNCIKAWSIPSVSGFEWALYPSEVVSDSNYATYVCDHCDYSSSGVVLYVGGGYGQGQYYGAFYLYGYSGASSAYANVGSRLQKLP